MKIKTIIVVTIILVATILLVRGFYFPVKLPDSENIPNSINLNEYAGTISTTTNGQLLYTSNKIGLKFTFPQGWHLGSNTLGYGALQLFNYSENEASSKDGFDPETKINKIEAVISSENSYTNIESQEKTRETEEMEINNQKIIRENIEFEYGAKLRFYSIPVPNKNRDFLGVVIYGNPVNFYVLDELVKTLKWLP